MGDADALALKSARAAVSWKTYVLVCLGAVAYFLVGIWYAVGWESGWIDSGLVVYGSWRVTEGALPYRDFDHMYGPALFHLNAALFSLFGVDLAVINLSLVGLKALFALVVLGLTTMAGAPRGKALFVTASFVAIWGSPLWLFSAPYAQHYGLLCAMAGLALAVRWPASTVAAVGAGLCCGVAATFKLTPGLFGFFALLAAWLSEPIAADGVTATRRAIWLGPSRMMVLVAVFVATGAYIGGMLRASADSAVLLTAVLLGGPFLYCLSSVALLRRARVPDIQVVRIVLAAAIAMSLPPLGYVAYYAHQGALEAFQRDLILLPQRLGWFIPLRVPAISTLLLALALLLAVGAGGGWRWRGGAIAVLVTVLAWLRPTGMPWATYAMSALINRTGYDVMTYAPFALVASTVYRLREPDLPMVHRQCLLFAAAQLLLLLPAADLWHALMGLPAFLPLLALIGGGTVGGIRRSPLRGAPAVWILVGLVTLPYVVQLATARGAWSAMPARFARATGMPHPGAKFGDVADLLQYLKTEPVRDRAVVILTGETMIYFLAGRVSAWERAEYVLQLIARDVDVPAAAPLLTDERRLLGQLKRARPLIVDFTHNAVRPRLAQLYPRVGRFLAKRYRPRIAFGTYQVFDRDSGDHLTTSGRAR